MPTSENRAKPAKTIKPAKNPNLIGTDKRHPKPQPQPSKPVPQPKPQSGTQ